MKYYLLFSGKKGRYEHSPAVPRQGDFELIEQIDDVRLGGQRHRRGRLENVPEVLQPHEAVASERIDLADCHDMR